MKHGNLINCTCILATTVWLCAPAFGQGDPVPPAPTPSTPTAPPVTETSTQPNFFQTLQQQQQIQSIFNSNQFPSFLQANPAISPLDQRSGLVNKSIKISTPFSSMTITIQVPNIKNSNLLAPSNTQVTNVQTEKPSSVTTTSNINQKPSFDSLGPLLDSLSKQQTNTTTATSTQQPTMTSTTTQTTSNINQKPSFDFLGPLLSNLANSGSTQAISDLAPTYFKNAYVVNIVVGLVDNKNVIATYEPKLAGLMEERNAQATILNRLIVPYDPNKKPDPAKVAAYNDQLKVFERADEAYQRAKTDVANAKAKIAELEKQAPDVFAAAMKEGVAPPRDLKVVTASTKELEDGAVEMTKNITELLTKVDLIASQIKFMEVTKEPPAKQEQLKKDLAYAVSLVKFTWTMLQRKPELTNLITYKLQQSNFNDYFTKVLNAPATF